MQSSGRNNSEGTTSCVSFFTEIDVVRLILFQTATHTELYCFLPHPGQNAAPERAVPHPSQNLEPSGFDVVTGAAGAGLTSIAVAGSGAAICGLTLIAVAGSGAAICTTTGLSGFGRKQQHLQHQAQAVIHAVKPAMRPMTSPATAPPSVSQQSSSEGAQQNSEPEAVHQCLSFFCLNAPQSP